MGRYSVSGSGGDCKSLVFDSGGSTPSLPTILRMRNMKIEEKEELVRLLMIYKKHLWDDYGENSNNLPYAVALLMLEEEIDHIIDELLN